jgi:hypothetical protein
VKLSARLGRSSARHRRGHSRVCGPALASSIADLDVNIEAVARALFDRLDPTSSRRCCGSCSRRPR